MACAQADGPILYCLGKEALNIDYVDFEPAFISNLYLVYLGKKQDTRASRDYYYQNRQHLNGTLEHVSRISEALPNCKTLDEFEKVIEEHEDIVAKCLNMPKIKDQEFPDYWGGLKSLGAWGGDMILATSQASDKETRDYFTKKGYPTIFKLAELMLTESHVESGV